MKQYETLNRITAAELQDELTANGFHIARKHTVHCDLTPPAPPLRNIYTEQVLTISTAMILASKTSEPGSAEFAAG